MLGVAIDAGTFSYCARAIKENQADFIRDPKSGSEIISSMIRYKQDKNVDAIGSAVVDCYWDNSRSVRCVKRILGYKMNTVEMRDFQKSCLRTVKEGKDGFPYFEMDCFPDKDLTPVKVTSDMIKSIAQLAERKYNQKVGYLVITVPAFFKQQQRKHTKDAAIMANICDSKNIHLVSEPVAAAVHYGVVNKKDQVIMVVDFGGGTADICIMRISGKNYNVEATDGDRSLGGEDITNALLEYVMKKYEENNGTPLIEVPETSISYQSTKEKLKRRVEIAKIELASSPSAVIDLADINQGYTKEDSDSDSDSDLVFEEAAVAESIEIKREELDEVAKPFVERVVKLAQGLLKQKKKKKAYLDNIILVGGSCRLHALQEQMKQEYGNKLVCDVNYLDTAVALGAQQAIPYTMGGANITISEIIAYHYGVVNSIDGKDVFETIIKKGTKTTDSRRFSIRRQPAFWKGSKEKFTYAEVPFKRSIDGKKVEGNVDPFIIQDISNIEGNMIEITLTIDKNGLIYIEAKQTHDGRIVLPKQEVCGINADLYFVYKNKHEKCEDRWIHHYDFAWTNEGMSDFLCERLFV